MKKFGFRAVLAFVSLFCLSQIAIAGEMTAANKELAEFVGLQNIAIQHLIACRASDIAMRELDFHKDEHTKR